MKKLINKNIIKAMTIGISALMVANSMNLTAFAGTDDVDTQPEGGTGDNTTTTTTPENTQSALSLALDDAGTVKTEVGTATALADDAVKFAENNIPSGEGAAEYDNTVAGEAEDLKDELDNAGKDDVQSTENTENKDDEAEGADTADDTSDAENKDDDADGADTADDTSDAENKDDDADGTSDADNTDDETGSAADAEDKSNGKADADEYAEDVETALKELDAQDTIISGAVSNLETAVDDANAEVEKGDQAVKDAEKALGIDDKSEKSIADVIDDTNKVIDEAQQNIDGSESEEEAQGYYEGAESAVNAASELVDKAREDFDVAKQNREDAKTAYDNKLIEIENLNKQLNGYDDEDGNHVAGAYDNYDALKGQADADAVAAEEELDRLAKEAEELKNAAIAAEDKYNDAGYAWIAAKEAEIAAKIKNETDPDWKEDYRELAKAIMEFDYVPRVLNGTDAKVEWKDNPDYDPVNVKGKNYYYEDGSYDSVGNALKYGVLTYTDKDGQTQTMLINWKTADANNWKTNADRPGIVIFEKEAHVSVDGKDLTADDLTTLNNGGEVERTIDGVDYVIKKNAAGVIESYKASGFQTVEGTVVTDSDNTVTNEDGSTVQTIVDVDETSENTSYSYDDGKFVKTVTADVTTTTYTTNSLSVAAHENSLATSVNSKEAFVEAINGLIDGLKASQEDKTITLKVGDTTVTFNKESQNISVNDDLTVYGYTERVTTTDTDSDIAASEINIATEDLAKEAYVDAINAILDGLTAEQSITINGKELKKADVANKTVTVDNCGDYGYVKAPDVDEDDASIDASAKDKATEPEAKQAYVDALNAILDGLTAEQSITINGKELKKADVANKTVTVDNCGDYGYAKTTKDDNEAFDGYSVNGKFCPTVKVSKTIEVTDSIAWFGSSKKGAIEEWGDDADKWINDYKDDDNKKVLNDSIDKDLKEDGITYKDTIVGKEWSAKGTVSLEYVKYKYEEINFSNIVDLFSDSQEKIKKEVEQRLKNEGKEDISFSSWDWKLFKATFKFIDPSESEAKEIYLEVAEDATDEEINAALANALKTETNGVYSAGYTSKTRVTHNYTTYGYDAITYKLNTNIYGYGETAFTQKTNLYGYGETAFTQKTNLYGYEEVDATKKTDTFGYAKVDYDETTTAVKQENGKTILVQNNSEVNATAKTEYRNDKWFGGDILLAEYDYKNNEYKTFVTNSNNKKDYKPVTVNATLNDGFRENVEAAATKAANYIILSGKAQAAKEAAETAKKDMETLRQQIAELYPQYANVILEDIGELPVEEMTAEDLHILKQFEADLSKAQEILEKAEEDRDTLYERLGELETQLGDKVEDLNKVDDNTNTDDNTTDDNNGGTTDDNKGSDGNNGGSDKDVVDNTNKSDDSNAGKVVDIENEETPLDDGSAITDDNGTADDGAGAADDGAGTADDGAGAADDGAGAADALDGGADAGDAGAAVDDGAVVDGGAGVDGGAPVIGGGANLFVAPGAPAAVDGDGAADGGAVVDDGGAAVDDNGGADVITEEIGDQEAALAGTIPEDEKKIYDIIDDPTALAELIEEPGVHIGWYWWILIIAALGATGYALYRKYKKNKAEEAAGGKKSKK